MNCLNLRAAIAATMMLIGGASAASANDYSFYYQEPWRQTAPPIFQNYYVPPPACGPGGSISGAGLPAQLYVSPLPVPAHVGHTYVTNQVFMPHEYMYKHHRTYYRWHDRGGNYTKTRVWFW
jgi:hypothetical protein